MSKIATETEARTIGGSGSAETGRMCTKARAIALGCNVASSYADNQLVQYEHLSKAGPTYFNFDILNDTASGFPNQPTISLYDSNNVYILKDYYIQNGSSTRERLQNGEAYMFQVYSQSISQGAPYKLQVLKPGGNWYNNSDIYDFGLAQYTDSINAWKIQGYVSYRHVFK